MVVQQHILNWLYSVLTSEYHHVNRTYDDVAQALSQYPSLSPRTDVHTFPNGVSALLVHLSGTIPVVFRGNTYRFPISLWVPHAYPREPPLVYVTPTEHMVVRPGQHVDPQGQVYHPYLVGWATFWDKSTILDFLAILRDVFAKEPPVVAKQVDRPLPPSQPPAVVTSPPPVPPPPPGMARPQSAALSPPSSNDQRPPPPPPKGNDPPVHRPSPVSAQPAPPLPPHPGRPLSQVGQPAPSANRLSRYESAPPLPPQTQSPHHTEPPPPARPPYQQPPPPGQGRHGPPPASVPLHHQHAAFQPPIQAPLQPAQPHQAWQQQSQSSPPHQLLYQQPPPHHAHPPQPQQHTQPMHAPPPQPTPKPPPPPDLMDEPLVLAIPEQVNVPAPPIPPNPEKDSLLHQLATTLHAMRQQSYAQNTSSLAGLQAQRTALLAALSAIQAESSSLAHLTGLAASNANILRDALARADAVVADARARRIPPPEVDELLVAPSCVANQLYDLVAEERALADAIFVLGRAVERGRVSPAVFAKTTRSLAREWYLKKALVRKIGRGMGLIQQ